jgi:hypothetical protein
VHHQICVAKQTIHAQPKRAAIEKENLKIVVDCIIRRNLAFNKKFETNCKDL